ncbi:MAG: RraA family protein [Hyphomicrobiales bacterium]
MIEEPPLLTIRRPNRRPTTSQIAAFKGIPAGFVVDALYGAGALSADIGLIAGDRASIWHGAGPALTANCGAADIMATIAALNFIQPGDMVVSAFSGHQGCATAGDRVAGMMKNSGASGFVTDGPIRDIDGVVAIGLPVWCTGLTPASPYTMGPGTVGLPIQIGGQQVETGDMIIGDRDGVVVVPFAQIDDVIEKLENVKELEKELDAEVADGLRVPASMVELLAGDQVKYIE